jgi:sugar/nucleoside kinase (ribokinase family)
VRYRAQTAGREYWRLRAEHCHRPEAARHCAQNALPVGHGVWADIIRNAMAKQDLHSAIEAETGDNGWCLALVEPDGERTFMSFSGVENQWQQRWLDVLNIPSNSLVYLSGYQLASPCGELLTRWLEGYRT